MVMWHDHYFDLVLSVFYSERILRHRCMLFAQVALESSFGSVHSVSHPSRHECGGEPYLCRNTKS